MLRIVPTNQACLAKMSAYTYKGERLRKGPVQLNIFLFIINPE